MGRLAAITVRPLQVRMFDRRGRGAAAPQPPYRRSFAPRQPAPRAQPVGVRHGDACSGVSMSPGSIDRT